MTSQQVEVAINALIHSAGLAPNVAKGLREELGQIIDARGVDNFADTLEELIATATDGGTSAIRALARRETAVPPPTDPQGNVLDPEPTIDAQDRVIGAGTSLAPGEEAAAPPTGERGTQEIADTILSSALQGAPAPSDFPDPVDYNLAYLDWLEIVNQAITVAQSVRELNAGLTRIDDNTLVTQEQFDALDPLAQSQVVQRFAQQQQEAQASYNSLLNALGLSEFQTARGALLDENARLSQDFLNRVTEIDQSLALDEANQQTALRGIDRQLLGQQESRLRAGLETDAQLTSAPFATDEPGKRSFTGADLGAGATRLAQQAGIRDAANIPLITFPGSTRVDPGALLEFGDEAAGVGGPLPEVPALQTDRASLPAAPTTQPIPQGGPTLLRPGAPPPQSPFLSFGPQGGGASQTEPTLPELLQLLLSEAS